MAVAAQIAGQRCDEHACGQRRQRLMPQLTGVLEAHDGARFIANLDVPAVRQWRKGDVLVDPGQQLPATRTWTDAAGIDAITPVAAVAGMQRAVEAEIGTRPRRADHRLSAASAQSEYPAGCRGCGRKTRSCRRAGSTPLVRLGAGRSLPRRARMRHPQGRAGARGGRARRRPIFIRQSAPARNPCIRRVCCRCPRALAW